MASAAIPQYSETPLTIGQWIGFFSMAIGVFMAVLDIQIVASSLQEIQAGLSATKDEIAWVQTSYLIAEVIIIPLSGWLGRVFSTRYLYVISAGGFTIASLLCAFAWNLPSMIVFRCLQGFLGGAMIPMTFMVIFIIFPWFAKTAVTKRTEGAIGSDSVTAVIASGTPSPPRSVYLGAPVFGVPARIAPPAIRRP